ncbi:LPXTG-motif cell wall-anchored protein [Neobacillus niacini]|uniref:LPXTG cell wall anchor domain-containing protein n=1 Tax=Neobacillus niacini TaxID=86668 RepID=UPI002862E6A8|nr:LPXTG cell wall anchor domain-containing protein [Neobacillus niacini]MDR7075396.1 LPXTG-motif cell wall-anchored protein [Neobacillus niacini]
MKIIKICLLIFLLIFPLKVFGNVNSQILDLTVNPQKVLFGFSNLKPGDSMERILIIGNNGANNFNYKITSKFIDGSQKFYDQLLLTITNKNITLFQGKLRDFNGLQSMSLNSGSQEELVFNINVPGELGNEFQGLTSTVEFKFYVEGTLGGVLPADGPKLPNTGSNMFNILVIGAALVLTGSFFQFIVKRRKKLDNQV